MRISSLTAIFCHLKMQAAYFKCNILCLQDLLEPAEKSESLHTWTSQNQGDWAQNHQQHPSTAETKGHGKAKRDGS